jgi:hypothetical protein
MTKEERKLLNKKYLKKLKNTFIGIGQAFSNSFNYTIRCYWFVDILAFLFKKDEKALIGISDNEYNDLFLESKTEEQKKFIYQQAWSAKNFEIELYWKRAQYFWAFQIAAFAGYFAVLNSNSYTQNPPKNPEVLFFVVCIGFITAIAWSFINQGSKTWQRHWENHVDMLEKSITGPLYQIVTAQKTFSVSKINDIVSRFFVFIWILLAIKYIKTHLTLNPFKNTDLNILIFLSIVATIYFSGAMYLGYGRGRFGERNPVFYKRKT